MSPAPAPLRLLAGLGIELEYMIVDAESLSVRSIADELIRAECGAYQSTVDRGDLSWSNELALHVVELKTSRPVTQLDDLPDKFLAEVTLINALLKDLDARLMPTAMHPWMDPSRETRLWPHDYNPVYEAFNRVFDCRGHGWSNLQSCHLNLPFGDDREFARLHAAIRLILPLLPALAASSPFQGGRLTGCLDNRLDAYRNNCARIPSVTGRVIPEAVFTPQGYRSEILEKMYHEIAPFDPEGTLQEEWLNARGAIARFERNTIEIRMLDVQECPQADLAIAAATQALVRALVEERWTDLAFQQSLSTDRLEVLFLDTMRRAESAVISDTAFLRALGLANARAVTAGELWRHLLEQTHWGETSENRQWKEPLNLILTQGSLASRIARATGTDPSPHRLRAVYAQLCQCLSRGRPFQPC